MPHDLGQFYLVITVTHMRPVSDISKHLQPPDPSHMFLAGTKSLKMCNMNLLSHDLNLLFLVPSAMNVKEMMHSRLAPTFASYLGSALQLIFRLYFFRLVSIQISARTHYIYTEKEKLLCTLKGFTAQCLQRV